MMTFSLKFVHIFTNNEKLEKKGAVDCFQVGGGRQKKIWKLEKSITISAFSLTGATNGNRWL